MEKITILGLLENYWNWVSKGKIQFLKKGSSEQKDVLVHVKKLISDFKKATEKPGELSENLDWYKTHQKGRELWEILASHALNYIDPESKGNSQLFSFLDAATNFEDLLYGLEPYYRDHTLHSLWVYFIGEHILRDLLPNVHDNLNWYLYNDIERDEYSHSPILLKDAKKKEKEIYKKVNENKDAIWCILALCHDLGYSLAKLDKLNEKAKDVLRFFDLPDFRHIGYSLDIEHQYIVSQFLELMAMDVRIVPSSNNKDVLIKCYRDDSTYWRLCRAIEKKQHGILSSYLIYKILGIFADTWVRGPAEEWGLEDSESIDNIIRGVILFAIAQHEFDFAYIDEFSGLGEVLIIADELEEFSRYGRQLLSRKYHDTMAESKITFIPKNPVQGKDIEINIKYEVVKHEDLNKFYKRKAERLCKIYSIRQNKIESNVKLKYCKIKSIKMTTQYEDEKLVFNLCKGVIKAYLPKTETNGGYNPGNYNLLFRDDKLYVETKDDKKITLDDWIKDDNK